MPNDTPGVCRHDGWQISAHFTRLAGHVRLGLTAGVSCSKPGRRQSKEHLLFGGCFFTLLSLSALSLSVV